MLPDRIFDSARHITYNLAGVKSSFCNTILLPALIVVRMTWDRSDEPGAGNHLLRRPDMASKAYGAWRDESHARQAQQSRTGRDTIWTTRTRLAALSLMTLLHSSIGDSPLLSRALAAHLLLCGILGVSSRRTRSGAAANQTSKTTQIVGRRDSMPRAMSAEGFCRPYCTVRHASILRCDTALTRPAGCTADAQRTHGGHTAAPATVHRPYIL